MPEQVTIKPYGSWKSPIQAEDIYASSIGINSLQNSGKTLFWNERRPDGRSCLVRRGVDGRIEDITPPPYDVRTRVHEYGGGEYLVVGELVFFANLRDQLWYQVRPGKEISAITHEPGQRFADAIADLARNRLIAVREDHTQGTPQPVNSLVAVSLEGENVQTELVAGNDFYANPRLSPDGKKLAWLTWNHPNMPWDGTELWLGEVMPDGTLGAKRLVAGGLTESIFQPEWSPDGRLYFVSDRTGWWNLYRMEGEAIEAIHPMEAEFGLPQWVFGMRTYTFLSAERILCVFIQNALEYLAILDLNKRDFQVLDLPYTVYNDVRFDGAKVYFIASSTRQPTALVALDLANLQVEVIRRVRESGLDPAYVSVAQPIEFPTGSGLTAYGIYYPPCNPGFAAPQDDKPPLLVISHGGPTGATQPVFSLSTQYWTTRGFAVLDVNYGGSTGYGRAYRERLKGRWGMVDVEDCIQGAQFLVSQGLADAQRLAIRGGSAGGYTTLCALTFFNVMKAGASYFGVSDLEALAKDTHKFESRYLDSVVGPYPERRDLYLERSPIQHVDRLSCPMIILQGLEDPVVPPNQAEMMYQAVKQKGLPVAYVTFPGERHGFLKAENNKRALEAEAYFYSRIFHFELADAVEPVDIENL